MKCQRCQKREADVIIKQNINGVEKEYKMCQFCLEELGFKSGFGFDLDKFLGNGFKSPKMASNAHNMGLTGNYNSGVFVPNKQVEKVCKHCLTSLDEIRKKGKLGCNYCYEAFEDQLGQVFRRVQSGEKHRGRTIAETKEKNEINTIIMQNDDLQNKIKEAVEKEDYESAAKYKTMIILNKQRIDEIEKEIVKEKNRPAKSKKSENDEKKINEIELHEYDSKQKKDDTAMQNKKNKETNNKDINDESIDKNKNKNKDSDKDNDMDNDKDNDKDNDMDNNINNKTTKNDNPAKSDKKRKKKQSDEEGVD